eukprot:SAG31_NODE_10203_length_1171_cov_1.309701_2_plen_124_part_01
MQCGAAEVLEVIGQVITCPELHAARGSRSIGSYRAGDHVPRIACSPGQQRTSLAEAIRRGGADSAAAPAACASRRSAALSLSLSLSSPRTRRSCALLVAELSGWRRAVHASERARRIAGGLGV